CSFSRDTSVARDCRLRFRRVTSDAPRFIQAPIARARGETASGRHEAQRNSDESIRWFSSAHPNPLPRVRGRGSTGLSHLLLFPLPVFRERVGRGSLIRSLTRNSPHPNTVQLRRAERQFAFFNFP